MAEEIKKTVSVIVPTAKGSDLMWHYLPQLCAHVEECSGVGGYEVLVCDMAEEPVAEEALSSLPHLRYIHAGSGATEVESINKGVFAASMDFVLVLADGMVPTHAFFGELFALFRYVPSFFGAGGTLHHGYTQRSEGARTIDADKFGVVLKTVPVSSRKPVYSLALPPHNMLVLRKQLCQMGGFSTLYQRADFAKNDLCIRAWRLGRKCLFSPSAFSKSISADEGENTTENLRQNNVLYDQIVLDYMHSTNFAHLFFWMRLAAGLLLILASRSSSAVAQKEAYGLFAKNFWKKIRLARKWFNRQHPEPLDKVVGGFFSGPQLQELSITE